MADQSKWDRKSVNQAFIDRGREANRRWNECLAKAKTNPRYRWFADEAAAMASVYDYLDGRSFLESRGELLAALKELRTLPAPKLEVFDRETFAGRRLSEIDRLLNEFAE
jgi:hypothetical protein